MNQETNPGVQTPPQESGRQRGRKEKGTGQYMKRMLKTPEIIKLGDWLRTPGKIDGLRSYQEIANKATDEKVLELPPSPSSVENVMDSCGLHLWKPSRPNDPVAALARAFINLCERVGEDDAITPEIRALAAE